MAAIVRKPSSRPGPRNERPDVRFALSYDALKINGMPSRRVSSVSRAASSPAWRSLSTTHGPATSTNGRPPPMAMAPIVTGFTAPIVSGDRLGGSSREAVRHFVAIARFDEARKQRVRAGRLRLELRMELHGHI